LLLFSSRTRHTRFSRDWSSDVCSSDLLRRGSDLAAFLKSFTLDPRFSVGVWYFNPADNRFHDPYQPVLSIEERLERIASLAPLRSEERRVGTECRCSASEVRW